MGLLGKRNVEKHDGITFRKKVWIRDLKLGAGAGSKIKVRKGRRGRRRLKAEEIKLNNIYTFKDGAQIEGGVSKRNAHRASAREAGGGAAVKVKGGSVTPGKFDAGLVRDIRHVRASFVVTVRGQRYQLEDLEKGSKPKN